LLLFCCCRVRRRVSNEKMYSYWVRLNAVFFYGLNVLLGLAVMTWLSCKTSKNACYSCRRPPAGFKLREP